MATRKSPQLGVFWIVGARLVAFTESAANVPAVGGFKDSSLAHHQLWEAAVKAEPSLAGGEYWERPRGRVLYSVAEDRYRVFLPNKYGCDHRLIRRIAARFSLPIAKVKICFALVIWSMREAEQRGHAVDAPVLAELTKWVAELGDGKFGLTRPAAAPKAASPKAVWFALAPTRSSPQASRLWHPKLEYLFQTLDPA